MVEMLHYKCDLKFHSD